MVRLVAASPAFAEARARPSSARLRLGVRSSARSNHGTASFGAADLEQQLAVELVGALDRVRTADRPRHPALEPHRLVHLREGDAGNVVERSPPPPRARAAGSTPARAARRPCPAPRPSAARRGRPPPAERRAAAAALSPTTNSSSRLSNEPCPAISRPALALDHLARPHRALVVAQLQRPAAAADLAVGVVMAADGVGGGRHRHRLVDLGDQRRRLGEPSQLGQLVVQPGQAVEVALHHRTAAAIDPRHRRRPRRPIAVRRLLPVSELHEEVRRHVEGVARRRGDRRVGPGRGQAARRQGAVIVGVQD